MLEEYCNYTSVGGTVVALRGTIDHDQMLHDYRNQLVEILKIKGKSYEEIDELLQEEEVIVGLTTHPVFISGYWHKKTGKCLWGNTGGSMGRGEDLKNRLVRFDIKIELNNASSEKQI